MIYFVIFVLLVILRFSLKRTTKLRNELYWPLLVVLFLFSAFRFEVGCDWSGYLNQYYTYSSFPLAALWSEREPLWIGLYTLQSWLDLPYPWINVFSSLIFFFGVHVLARRQPDPFAFLLLLYPILIINMPMSGIRQATAIGVMGLAFVAFNARRMVPYVALVLTAAAFHASAIVFILLVPFVYGAFSKVRLLLAGILAIPGVLALMSTDVAEEATSRYVSSGVDAAGAAFRVVLLVITGLFFLGFLRRHWAETYPRDYKLVLVGSIIMSLSIVLVPFSSVIGDRFAYYLIPIQTMIFARIPYLPLRANRALFIVAPYLALILVFGVWTALSWHFQECYVPYQTWLFGYPGGAVSYQ